jgi:Cu-processing system permease protein
MINVLRYSFSDLMRSRWSYVYFLFYLILGFVLLFLNNNLSKAIITLMNVIIVLTPLIGTVFGVMYFYNSREFSELLLALPIKRKTIFIGQFLGLSISLSLSLLIGLGIPFLSYGIFESDVVFDFVLLLFVGIVLTFIFSGLSFSIALYHDNKIKGFSYSILTWLLLALVYDGFFLVLLIVFREYPLDYFSLIGTVFNPIDLSRILILLKLDISALLGFSGALFKNFFGAYYGMLTAYFLLFTWVSIPFWMISFVANRKDF